MRKDSTVFLDGKSQLLCRANQIVWVKCRGDWGNLACQVDR